MKGVDRWAAGFDNHGNKADNGAVGAFREFCKFFKPTVRIHGGDGFNFACLRKGAGEQEQREKLTDDVDAGLEFIRWYKPTKFLRGNHDERAWDAAKSDDGKLSEFAAWLIMDIKEALGDIEILPYDKRRGVLRYGDHSFIHGYNHGIYAARHAAAAYGNVCMGHVHADDEQSVPRIDGARGHSSGCLCVLDQDYNRAHLNTLRQSHGWLYGFNVRGKLIVHHARQVGGKWILPTEFREVA